MARGEDLQRQGRTVIFAAVDELFAGLLAVADPIKQSARTSIEELRRLGVQIVMLTGDNEHTAKAVAAELGIEQVEAGGLHNPTPIGFYFAKLWYFEKLYPIIFTVAALGRALQKVSGRRDPAHREDTP